MISAIIIAAFAFAAFIIAHEPKMQYWMIWPMAITFIIVAQLKELIVMSENPSTASEPIVLWKKILKILIPIAVAIGVGLLASMLGVDTEDTHEWVEERIP